MEISSKNSLEMADLLELVPKFDGNIFNFHLFWDTYNALIEGYDLKEVFKISILHRKLDDASLSLIPKCASLEEQKACLVRHYTSKHRVRSAINRLFNTLVQVISDQDLDGLERFYAHSHSCHCLLRCAGFTDFECRFLLRAILTKLPKSLCDKYLNSTDEVPTLVSTLITFLDDHIKTLYAVADDLGQEEVGRSRTRNVRNSPNIGKNYKPSFTQTTNNIQTRLDSLVQSNSNYNLPYSTRVPSSVGSSSSSLTSISPTHSIENGINRSSRPDNNLPSNDSSKVVIRSSSNSSLNSIPGSKECSVCHQSAENSKHLESGAQSGMDILCQACLSELLCFKQ